MIRTAQDFYVKHIENNERNQTFILITVTIFVIGMLVLRRFIINGDPFFSLSRWSDLIRTNLPTYLMLYDCLANGGHLWSWNMGIGTSMFSHADVYFDPFTYVTFVAGRDNIAHMMGWSFLLKLICEGLSFAMYLRTFKLSKFAICVSSTLYAFCGYSLIMGVNLALGTVLVYFPLILLFIEKMISETKFNYLLLVPLTLLCICTYYYFYISAILIICYIIIRSLLFKRNNLVITTKLILFAIIAMLISVLISFFAFWPQADLLLNNPRAGGGKDIESVAKVLKLDVATVRLFLCRTFGINLLGSFGNYTGSIFNGGRDYFQGELFVTPLTTVVLLLLARDPKYRKNIILIACIVLMALAFPFVSYVFNAFTTVNYRWVFIAHILICISIAFCLNKIRNDKRVDIKFLTFAVITSLVLLLLLSVSCSYSNNNKPLDTIENNWIEYFITFLFLICVIPLAYFYNRFNGKLELKKIVAISAVILIATCTLFSYNDFYDKDKAGTGSLENDSEYGYDGPSYDVIKNIQSNDHNIFYRIHKDFDPVYDVYGIPSNNDAMAQNYYGLKNYSSMNNGNYVDFLQTVGVYVCTPTETSHYKETHTDPRSIKGQSLNYINGVDDCYELLDYFGVKYYLSYSDSAKTIPEQFTFIETLKGIDVYKNENTYSLAFINSNYMTYSDFMKLSFEDRRSAILNYTITENADDDLSYGTTDNAHYNCIMTDFNNDDFSFEVDVSGPYQYVSFSIPYDDGWAVYVDGEKVDTYKINIALLGIKICGGHHNVFVKYESKCFKQGLIVSFVTLLVLITIVLEKKHHFMGQAYCIIRRRLSSR